MFKNTILEMKSVEKKEKLKKYSEKFISTLKEYIKSADFDRSYPADYLSDNGLIRDDFVDLVDRLENCASSTIYGKKTIKNLSTGETTEHTQTVESHSCHSFTLCPVCASAKRTEILSSINPKLQVLKDLAKYQKVFLYTGCITIEKTDDPGEQYEKIRNDWTKFNKLGQRRKSGKNSKGEASKIIGSILSIEAVPELDNSTGKTLYHVHGHVFLVTSSPLDYSVYDQEKKKSLEYVYGKNSIPEDVLDSIALNENKLSKITGEWFKVSGCKNFFVNPLKDRIFSNKKTGEKKVSTIEKQLFEVVKYSTKPWELSPADAFKLYETLLNKKRITKSGIFTNRKNDINVFKTLLIDNDLTSKYFQLENAAALLSGFDDVEEGTEILSTEFYNVEYDQERKTLCVGTTPWRMAIRKEKEWKEFLTDRVNIVNIYRNHLKNIKEMIPCVKMGLVDKMDLIRDKKRIKAEMRETIFKRSVDLALMLKPTTIKTACEAVNYPKQLYLVSSLK